MNPVENPLVQIMQAFGAAPSDAAIAAFGVAGESGTSEADVTTRFAGYIESASSATTPTSGIALAGKASENAQLIHAVPTDAAFAVDPTTAAAPTDIKVHALSDNSALLASGTVRGDQITPETAAAYSLAVNYRATTPVALSASDLQVLHSVTPAQYAALSASPAATSAPNAIGTITPNAQLAQQSPDMHGQFLPASDLKFIFGETPTVAAGQADSAQALAASPVTNAQTPVLPAVSAEQISVSHSADTTAKPLASAISPAMAPSAGSAIDAAGISGPEATPTLSYKSGNTTASIENGLEISRVNLTAIKPTAQAAQSNVQAEPEADGQILTVTQKAQNPANTPTAAVGQTNNNTAMAAQGATAALQPAATPNAATSGNLNKRGDENPADSRGTRASKAAVAPAMQPPTGALASAPQGTVDWTSSWVTPERAAGWPDGFATSLISTGLGGLMGNPASLSGISMLGGQPNPTLGSHVSKQLNLHMTRAVKAGEQEFSMRMDPPELGRVSVKLTFGQNGLVKSQIMAERPETLEMLQREIRGLERAIEAGGHKTEQGGISFSLDSGGQESAGKAFAEAMQQDRLQEEMDGRTDNQHDDDFAGDDELEAAIDLDDILAHVTPETGLDVRV